MQIRTYLVETVEGGMFTVAAANPVEAHKIMREDYGFTVIVAVAG